jgi:hypothetical protein
MICVNNQELNPVTDIAVLHMALKILLQHLHQFMSRSSGTDEQKALFSQMLLHAVKQSGSLKVIQGLQVFIYLILLLLFQCHVIYHPFSSDSNFSGDRYSISTRSHRPLSSGF